MAKFERELSVIVDIADHVSKVSRKIMLNIDRRVVRETPVDTASAKRSWLAGVNQSPDGLFDLADGTPVSGVEAEAIAQGAATISGAKGFDDIYVVNNQPYIERLNQGYSLQAPSNYIDAIISQEVARVK